MRVESHEPYRLTQLHREIDFGKMRGLQRVFYYIAAAVELGLEEKHEEVVAFLIQLMKCIHQVVIDNGTWEDGVEFLPLADPLGKAEFAGDESEIEAVASRREALATLRKSRKGLEKDKKDGD